jgi:hypothetical protein
MRCMNDDWPLRAANRTSGLTLLEVLVSCGILVVGLTSLAALLPASGFRLAQAAMEDRAGSLAANARTEARSRGLTRADIFSDPDKGTVLGTVAPLILQLDPMLATDPNRVHFAATAKVDSRIDPGRGFLSEDQIVFDPPTTAITPTNLFTTQGYRAFQEGMNWGATLVPNQFPATSGGAAKYTVAVFRRPPTGRLFVPEQVSGSIFAFTSSQQDGADASALKQFLKGCTHVLVFPKPRPPQPPPPPEPPPQPAWVRVTASWTLPTENSAKHRSFVVLDFTGVNLPDYLWPVSSTPPQAGATQPDAKLACKLVAFDGLIRLDQHTVILE